LEKRRLAKARATVRLIFGTKQQADAIAKALSPELFHPVAERAMARLVVRGLTMSLHFEAKDSIALRAIMSSALRILAASLNVSDSLIQLEHSYSISKSDKSKVTAH
jgi:tRNA threonylcarbamoyladenosine modification (KEOPS) complex  Pcc1 subunit